MIGILLFIQLQARIDLSLILKLPSSSNFHKLGSDLHISSNHLLRNEDLSIQGISVTPITGLFEETNTLFDIVNSSLSLSNVEILIDADFSIAKLLKSSHIKIQSSNLDFGTEFTPFVADGGSVTLIDIVISGRATIPELMDSSTPDTNLTMSKCVAQDVIVGLSPIFGPSSYSVEVSLSVFANIDHAVPLLYSPSPPALHTFSIPSLETYSTILASSTMVNVTDDIYGAITNAPIVGKSFLFRDLLCEQQTVKTDVLSINAESPETMVIKTETNFKVKKTQFINSRDVNRVGVAGLFITATEDAKLTISSCSFDNLNSSGIAGLRVTAPNNHHFIRLIVKKCQFLVCSATHVTSATLGESSIEMDQVFWDECEGRNGVVFLTGRSPVTFSSDGGIELRSCGFQRCRSVSYSHSNLACLWISYAGPVLLHKQTTFKSCSTAFSSAFISAALVFIRETRFVECVATEGRAGGCTVKGYQVSLENVLLQSCQSVNTPNSLVVSLFFDWSLLKVLDTDERQKYEMKKCFIDRARNLANYYPDVAFAVPETTLVFGNLNATRFEKVFTSSDRNTVTMTTTDIVSSSSYATYSDQTAIVSKQGDDPRKDRRKSDSLRSETKGLSAGAVVGIVFAAIFGGPAALGLICFIIVAIMEVCKVLIEECEDSECCVPIPRDQCHCPQCPLPICRPAAARNGNDAHRLCCNACYCCTDNECNMCCNCTNCCIIIRGGQPPQ
ncbi:hypothetical protein BLNAU_19852 [Blattamonas nauphoetae]|uniref:Right handed beta helix domain-containing protein n=1 Tax=Blattamonas nauphoetae TaxID=2049346 RepID=A0ABQ9X0A3_9EUKA|nr:hypothetical protein BLNAU_19852 [Blattamonas nauphoetae]